MQRRHASWTEKQKRTLWPTARLALQHNYTFLPRPCRSRPTGTAPPARLWHALWAPLWRWTRMRPEPSGSLCGAHTKSRCGLAAKWSWSFAALLAPSQTTLPLPYCCHQLLPWSRHKADPASSFTRLGLTIIPSHIDCPS